VKKLVWSLLFFMYLYNLNYNFFFNFLQVTIRGVGTIIKQCPALASVMVPNEEMMLPAMTVGISLMKRGFNFSVADCAD
jgi:hypothetical protein